MKANRFRFRAWDPCRKIILLPDTKDDAGKDEWYGGEWEIFTGALGSVQDGWILMQSTGLADKNGREIFEGDVIESVTARGFIKPGLDRYIIKWDVVSWSVEFIYRDGGASGHVYEFGTMIDFNDCNVIGNIYENPELLKERPQS